MSKFDSLAELRKYIENWLLPNVNNILILINTEENHLSAIYDGRRMCKIYRSGEIAIRLEFEEGFYNNEEFVPQKRWCYIENLNSFVLHISNSIRYYNKKKGQKNMTKLRELRDYLLEHVSWNITTEIDNYSKLIIYDNRRVVCYIKEADGWFNIQYVHPYIFDGWSEFVYQLSNGTTTQSINNRLAKYNDDAIEKEIYMMSARGSGKTRWVSELLKNKTVVYNGNIHTNIENVIFNDPATIVFWTDGTKTVVKCQPGETFDPEKGLAMAISKKVLGNDYGYYETFAKHVGRYNKKHKEK